MAVRLALLWVLLVLVECFMRSTKLQVLVLITLLLSAGCGSSGTSSPLVTPTTGSSVNTFNESAVPTSKSFPTAITVGPDGNLWFTEGSGRKIGRITRSGTITEFAIPEQPDIPGGLMFPTRRH